MKTLWLSLAIAVLVAGHGSRVPLHRTPPEALTAPCGRACAPLEGLVARWDQAWETDTTLMMDMIGAAGDCPLCGPEREFQVLEVFAASAAGIGGYRPPVVAQIFDPSR